MQNQPPPTIDPQAAARWGALAATPHSPWLHEEVARRMEQRLQWIVRQPEHWLHWEPLRAGLKAHALLQQRYPGARSYVHEVNARALQTVRDALRPAWWQLARRAGSSVVFSAPPAPVQMLWSNMALHMSADPQALLQQWLGLLEVDGILMFSCLGPDTLAQLRSLYQNQGWPAPAHQFTDMHDWGDMLVGAGFAEPVMDMEKITLTFGSPESLLAELRELGRNLHRERFGGLRGRRWLADLHRALERGLAQGAPDGRMQLSFEIIYGHAIKPLARLPVRAHSSIALQDFRAALAAGKSVAGLPKGLSGHPMNTWTP